MRSEVIRARVRGGLGVGGCVVERSRLEAFAHEELTVKAQETAVHTSDTSRRVVRGNGRRARSLSFYLTPALCEGIRQGGASLRLSGAVRPRARRPPGSTHPLHCAFAHRGAVKVQYPIQQGGDGSPPLRSVPRHALSSTIDYTAHLHRRRSSCGMREGGSWPCHDPLPSLPSVHSVHSVRAREPHPLSLQLSPSLRPGLRVPRRRRRRRPPLPLPLPLSTPFGHARSSPWRFTSTYFTYLRLKTCFVRLRSWGWSSRENDVGLLLGGLLAVLWGLRVISSDGYARFAARRRNSAFLRRR